MALTLNEIVEEARGWPCDQVAELVDHLTLSLHQRIEPEVEEAWRQVTRRRIGEIQGGGLAGLPGEEVSQRVRQIVGDGGIVY